MGLWILAPLGSPSVDATVDSACVRGASEPVCAPAYSDVAADAVSSSVDAAARGALVDVGAASVIDPARVAIIDAATSLDATSAEVIGAARPVARADGDARPGRARAR